MTEQQFFYYLLEYCGITLSGEQSVFVTPVQDRRPNSRLYGSYSLQFKFPHPQKLFQLDAQGQQVLVDEQAMASLFSGKLHQFFDIHAQWGNDAQRRYHQFKTDNPLNKFAPWVFGRQRADYNGQFTDRWVNQAEQSVYLNSADIQRIIGKMLADDSRLQVALPDSFQNQASIDAFLENHLGASSTLTEESRPSLGDVAVWGNAGTPPAEFIGQSERQDIHDFLYRLFTEVLGVKLSADNSVMLFRANKGFDENAAQQYGINHNQFHIKEQDKYMQYQFSEYSRPWHNAIADNIHKIGCENLFVSGGKFMMHEDFFRAAVDYFQKHGLPVPDCLLEQENPYDIIKQHLPGSMSDNSVPPMRLRPDPRLTQEMGQRQEQQAQKIQQAKDNALERERLLKLQAEEQKLKLAEEREQAELQVRQAKLDKIPEAARGDYQRLQQLFVPPRGDLAQRVRDAKEFMFNIGQALAGKTDPVTMHFINVVLRQEIIEQFNFVEHSQQGQVLRPRLDLIRKLIQGLNPRIAEKELEDANKRLERHESMSKEHSVNDAVYDALLQRRNKAEENFKKYDEVLAYHEDVDKRTTQIEDSSKLLGAAEEKIRQFMLPEAEPTAEQPAQKISLLFWKMRKAQSQQTVMVPNVNIERAQKLYKELCIDLNNSLEQLCDIRTVKNLREDNIKALRYKSFLHSYLDRREIKSAEDINIRDFYQFVKECLESLELVEEPGFLPPAKANVHKKYYMMLEEVNAAIDKLPSSTNTNTLGGN